MVLCSSFSSLWSKCGVSLLRAPRNSEQSVEGHLVASCVAVDPFISSVGLSAAHSTRGLEFLCRIFRAVSVCSWIRDGALQTGGGVQTAAAALLAGRWTSAGSGSPPSACAVDDAGQLRVREGEPDGCRDASCPAGSAGPKDTTTTTGELRDPAPAARLAGGCHSSETSVLARLFLWLRLFHLFVSG